MEKERNINHCQGFAVCRLQQRTFDPEQKLHHGQPIVINQILAVDRCEANGAHRRLEGLQLKPGTTINDLERVQVDGCHDARCASVIQIQCLALKNKEAPKDAKGNCPLVLLQHRQERHSVKHPMPLFGQLKKHTQRLSQGMSLLQSSMTSATPSLFTSHEDIIKNLLVARCHHADN
jgi:hypothetical protein